MRLLSACALVVVSGCNCGEDVSPIENFEGEGEGLPTEGEGEGGVGEGEGEGGEGGEGEGEGGEGEGEVESCTLDDLNVPGGDDKPRTLLIGFPFGADGGRGTSVGAFAVNDAGIVTGETDRIDVGFIPDRVAYARSGKWAVVVGEALAPVGGGQRGADRIASIDVSDPADLRVAANIDSGVFGLQDVVVTDQTLTGGAGADAVVVYAVAFDSSATGGVHVVTLGCDGALVVEDAPLLLRLSSSLALLPGDRALLLGGQVNAFDPRDPFDVRLLDLDNGGVVERQKFNLFGDANEDFFITDRVGASADGSFVVIANSASISAQNTDRGVVSVLDIQGDSVVERGRFVGSGGSQAVVAVDGSVVAVSNYEDDAVHIFDVTGTGDPTLVTSLTRLGLADHMAPIERGTLAGLVYLPVVDAAEPGGSFIATIDLGGGTGVVLAPRFSIGDGLDDIPDSIAISP